MKFYFINFIDTLEVLNFLFLLYSNLLKNLIDKNIKNKIHINFNNFFV